MDDRQLAPRLREVEDPGERQAVALGHRVFQQSCGFCHGVRDVGASFGWDVVDPVPLHDWRAPASLYHRVTQRSLQSAERGERMPALRHLGVNEVEALWRYLQYLDEVPPLPYRPGSPTP